MSFVSECGYDGFRCVILPGSGPKLEHIEEYNLSYAHWKRVWKRVMTHLTGPGTFEADTFFKQDFITTLFYGNEIVGQMCNRQLDLRTEVTPDLEYFQNFKSNARPLLAERGSETLLTIEWNSLNSKFSQRKTQFPFVRALFYMCTNLASALGADACTAVPRKITKVQQTLEEMGFRTTDKNLMQYRCPIDVMIGFVDEIRPPNASEVRAFVEHIWAHRLDTTGRSHVDGRHWFANPVAKYAEEVKGHA